MNVENHLNLFGELEAIKVKKASVRCVLENQKNEKIDRLPDDRKVIPMVSVFPSRLCFWNDYNGVHHMQMKDLFSPEDWDNILKNLKENKARGILSVKSSKRAKTAIDWMLHLSPVLHFNPSKIFPKSNELKAYKDKNIDFKINFITLTLPCYQVKSYVFKSGKEIFINDKNPYFKGFQTCIEKVNFYPQVLPGGIEVAGDDHYVKSYLLNQFLIELKNKYNCRDYVWRAETQGNGNIHFHITLNKFIYHQELRDLWNRILSKSNMITKYQDKHKNMSEYEYVQRYYKKGKNKKEALKKAYWHNKKINWNSPNSTDVHAVWKLKNIKSYLCKYICKENPLRRAVVGFLWRSSESISKLKSVQLEVSGQLRYDVEWLQKKFPECRYCPSLNPKCEADASSFIDVFKFDIVDLSHILPESEIIREFIKYKAEKLKIPEMPLN